MFCVGLTGHNDHRKSKDIQSSSQSRRKPSNEDGHNISNIYGSTGCSEGPKDKFPHKRKHDAYIQDDQRRYSGISETIPHMSQMDYNAAISPRSNGIFAGRKLDVVFRKV